MAEVPLVTGRLINAWELGASRSAAAARVNASRLPIFSEGLSEGSHINWRGIGYAIGAGALSGGLLGGAALGFKKVMDIDSARSSLGKRPRGLPEPLFNKRQRMDQLMVAAGGLTTRNRYQNKQKLKSGRLGRKLQRECAEFIQRWQRIYPFGNNFIAYPASGGPTGGSTQEENPGTNKNSWFGASFATTLDKNTGRLCLSHVAPIVNGEQTKIQLLPGYLFDITSWHNTTDAGDKTPIPMKRLAIDNDGNFQFVQCAQQGADADFSNLAGNDGQKWFGESGPTGVSLPNTNEQRAVLAWNEIRMNMYGAKKRCTKIHVEFIQFKDEKYSMQFHPDGEKLASMSIIDQQDVKLFWINEFKRLTFNPLVVNTFIRNKAVKVLKSETFCVNADDTTNEDEGPPVVQKSYFKRFNRLVKWNWQTQNITLDPVYNPAKPQEGGMENPDFQVTDQAQMAGYAHPHARIYLYIRAEDFEEVSGVSSMGVDNPEPDYTFNAATGALPAQPAGTVVCGVDVNTTRDPGVQNYYYTVPRLCPATDYYASDDHVTFDIIVRNKWKVQT